MPACGAADAGVVASHGSRASASDAAARMVSRWSSPPSALGRTVAGAAAPARRARRPAGGRGLDAGVRPRRLPRAEQRRLRHGRAQRRSASRSGGSCCSARWPASCRCAFGVAGLGRDRAARRVRAVDGAGDRLVGERASAASIELGRVATYLGVLVLAIALQGRAAARHTINGLACAIGLVTLLAVLSRLHPQWFPANDHARVPRRRQRAQAQLPAELLERAGGVRGDGRAAAARRGAGRADARSARRSPRRRCRCRRCAST